MSERFRLVVDRASFAGFILALAGFAVGAIWSDWTAMKFCASVGVVCLGIGILTLKPRGKTST